MMTFGQARTRVYVWALRTLIVNMNVEHVAGVSSTLGVSALDVACLHPAFRLHEPVRQADAEHRR